MHTLQCTQRLPVSITEAWKFFSSPGSLESITPAYMSFKIIDGFKAGDPMVENMRITYTVKPVLGIPLKWVTLISEVKEPFLFVDKQLKGPYAYWRHEHRFKEIEGGVEMTDIITYKVHFGILGRFAKWLFVGRQLKQIFDYRYKTLEEVFGKFA